MEVMTLHSNNSLVMITFFILLIIVECAFVKRALGPADEHPARLVAASAAALDKGGREAWGGEEELTCTYVYLQYSIPTKDGIYVRVCTRNIRTVNG